MKNKKILVIVLSLILITSMSVSSLTCFADEVSDTEREEIIEVVKKGWYLYDMLCGHAWEVGPVLQNLANKDENVLEYSQDFLCKDCEIIKADLEQGEKWISYYETHFKNENEYIEYVNSIFIGSDAETKINDRTKIINGKLYLGSNYDAGVMCVEWDYDNCEIREQDDKIVVYLKNTTGSDYQNTECNVELKENNGEYQIIGGTMFGGFDEVYDEYYVDLYEVKTPDTGEDVIFYTTIALTSLAVGVDILVRKRKKEID